MQSLNLQKDEDLAYNVIKLNQMYQRNNQIAINRENKKSLEFRGHSSENLKPMH